MNVCVASVNYADFQLTFRENNLQFEYYIRPIKNQKLLLKTQIWD